MTYKEYVETITNLLKPRIVSTLKNYIFLNYPGFSLPIIKYFTEMIIDKIVSLSFEKTELLIYMKHIDLRMSEQGKEFYQQALSNSNVQNNPESTNEEKEKAKQALINSFNKFVVLNR